MNEDQDLLGGILNELTDEEREAFLRDNQQGVDDLQETQTLVDGTEEGQTSAPTPEAMAEVTNTVQDDSLDYQGNPRNNELYDYNEEGRPFKKPQEDLTYLGQPLGETFNQVRGRMNALGDGVIDAGIDLVNLVEGVDVPKIPKYEEEVTQSIRELSSIILPTMMGTGAALGQIGKATKGVKFLNDPIVKYLGTTALSAGVGAAVDYTVEFNGTDDNAAGALKKAWPRTYGWISDDIATLDSDSEDIKRIKNVTEGAYLGIGSDMLLGLTKLFRNVRGMHTATKWVGENEKGAKWFKENVELDETPEDVIERSAGKRSFELDEIGNYNADRSVDPTDVIFGKTDLYGYQEQGVRSVDDLGIIGASKDAARIDQNIGTVYGRIGSVMSEGALKFANETSENARLVIQGLASTLQDAGKYGYKVDDSRYLSFEEIKNVGEKYASDFYEMDLQELQRTIYPGSIYQGRNVSTKTPELTDEAYSGVMGAIKKYMDDFINMDEAKATAYVGTSLAGQVSDMAQGLRLTEGSASVLRAQEQILDRVEFLMAQKGMTSYVRGRALKMLHLWMTTDRSKAFDAKEAKRLDNLIKSEKNSTLSAMERIKQETTETINNLRDISDNNHEMLAPLFMAYELTDGNVKSITALNNYVRQSTSILKKAFFDRSPEIPSVINKAFYANVYNATLAAFGTPIKAGISATHLLVEKPIRTFAGALMAGETATIRRGIYQYNNMLQSMKASTSYMGQIFKRTALDPNVIEARDDLGLKNKAQLDILNAFANGKAKQGELGPQALMESINAMNAIAEHPIARLGTRSMQAIDGFVQSMIANFEAKGRAFDEVTKGGTIPFDRVKAEEQFKKFNSEMFNEDGIITDKAVKKAAGEISLNLDNEVNTGLSALITRMPVLKPFLLFTKTPLNELTLTASYSPQGVLAATPINKFVEGLSEFQLPFDEMPMEKVKELLTKRGIEITPYTAKAKYSELRSDMIGRSAMGTVAVMGAVGLFMNDRIHGSGHYNRQVQKTRRELGWKPITIKGDDGKWTSFDGLGPITNYLRLTVDIMDNMDTLSPNNMGELLKKLSFVFAASFTDKTMLTGIEPFMDILRGDVGAINRWSTSFITAATVRGSSQMAEIARLMDPGLKQVENDFKDMMMNRNPLTKGQLPIKYDWIDGGPVGIPDNFFARLRNTYTPWKESGIISDEKQFLIDIEYDATPNLQTNGRGVKLTNEEQSDVLSIMGETHLWRDGIQRVMKSTTGKEFRKRFREAQSRGVPADTKTWESLHAELDMELRDAIGDAMIHSKHYTEVMRREEVQKRTGEYMKRGNLDAAERYLGHTRKHFGY